MPRFTIALVIACAWCSWAHAQQFGIDSPLSGSIQSGAVAPPNGWRCPRVGEITARIDGGPDLQFTEDLSRGDTAGICGNTGNNGFALFPWNWNEVGDGPHTIAFFDAGVQFADISFEVATFGTPFLFDASGQCTIPDFPDPGADVEVSWDPAIQNVRITRVIDPLPAIPSQHCPGFSYDADRTATVSRVIDGDTIELTGGERIRYIGIDTPEDGEPGFSAATQRNTVLVAGATVILDVCEAQPLDPFGRTLAYVIVGTTVVNEVLLAEGLADPLHIPPCGDETAICYAQLGPDTPPSPSPDCDPAYPTVCIPSPPPDLDCGEISFRNFTVLSPDPHGFDGDNDGIGCET